MNHSLSQAAPSVLELADSLLDAIPLVMRSLAVHLRHQHPGLQPSQLGVLAAIVDQPRSQRELREIQQVSAATISVTVDALTSRGWVQRTPAPTDRRTVLVELTPVGREAFHAIEESVRAHLAAVLAPLTPQQRTSVQEAMRVLGSVLTPRRFPGGGGPVV